MKKNFYGLTKTIKYSCEETNKVLNENFIEVSSVLQSAFDDAILIGCDEDDFKKKL